MRAPCLARRSRLRHYCGQLRKSRNVCADEDRFGQCDDYPVKRANDPDFARPVGADSVASVDESGPRPTVVPGETCAAQCGLSRSRQPP